MPKRQDKLTLSLGFQERERLQQLAASLGIKARSGPGAHTSGSITGLAEALDAAYATDRARVLTLLARVVQAERPDVFGYMLQGNLRTLVRWTANHPASQAGLPVLIIAGQDDQPHTGNDVCGTPFRVPHVVTDEDLRWLAHGAFEVQPDTPVREHEEVVLV